MATLEELRTPLTEDEALETILGYLKAVGFNTDAWVVGSLQRSFIRVFAIVYASVTSLIASIADFGYNETSSGRALQEFSLSHYDNAKNLAVNTVGKMVLTNGGAVPYTILESDLVAAYTEIDGTQRTYRNLTGGSLGAGGSITLTWTAETAGAAWNIPSLSPLTLLTPLAGVTVTNPDVIGSTTWITTVGTDDEADDVLKERNRTKWATLSVESIHDTVVNVALSASSTIKRVGVNDNNPRGAGTVDVYVAGQNVTSGTDDVDAAQAKLAARFFGSTTVITYAAPEANVDLTGTVYFDSKQTAAAVQTAVEASLVAFLSTVPLGGFDYSPGPANVVPVNDIETAIANATINAQKVVKTVTLSLPAADIGMLSFAVAVRGLWNLTYTPVAA